MKYYEISYSTVAGGMILIKADCEDDAIDQFDAMEFDELFEIEDLLKGIEIEDIEEVKDIIG
jgi:hypothetical protein